jgi:hypothetical protein
MRDMTTQGDGTTNGIAATVLGLAGRESVLRGCLDPWLAAPHGVLAELTFL